MIAAGLGGCAAPQAPAPTPILVSRPDERGGIVLAVRPQAPGGAREAVLLALGEPLMPDRRQAPGADVTLRLADGRLVSVVQAASPHLKAGSRVVLRGSVADEADTRPAVPLASDRQGQRQNR